MQVFERQIAVVPKGPVDHCAPAGFGKPMALADILTNGFEIHKRHSGKGTPAAYVTLHVIGAVAIQITRQVVVETAGVASWAKSGRAAW